MHMHVYTMVMCIQHLYKLYVYMRIALHVCISASDILFTFGTWSWMDVSCGLLRVGVWAWPWATLQYCKSLNKPDFESLQTQHESGRFQKACPKASAGPIDLSMDLSIDLPVTCLWSAYPEHMHRQMIVWHINYIYTHVYAYDDTHA